MIYKGKTTAGTLYTMVVISQLKGQCHVMYILFYFQFALFHWPMKSNDFDNVVNTGINYQCRNIVILQQDVKNRIVGA